MGGGRVVEDLALQREETAHRIGDLSADDEGREMSGDAAGERPPGRESTFAAAVAHEPAADHDIGLVVLQLSHHGGEDGFVMLEVGIHDRDVGGG